MNVNRKNDFVYDENLSVYELNSLYNYFNKLYFDLQMMKLKSIKDDEFWDLVNKNYILTILFRNEEEVKNSCNELGIKYRKIKTEYLTYEYCYGHEMATFYYKDWLVETDEDIDEDKVYNDEELRNMLENNEIVLLNSNINREIFNMKLKKDLFVINGCVYCTDRLKEGNENYLNKCGVDLSNKKYWWYDSKKIMDKIRNEYFTPQFLDSEINYASFRKEELIYLARKKIKKNIEMKLKNNYNI